MKRKSSRGNFFDRVTLQSLLSDLSHAISLERLGPRITSRVLWRAHVTEPKLALTFDDGPDPENTPQMLDVLNRFAVPATFFLIGRHVEDHFDLAQEILNAGHEVGNHTYSHLPMIRLSEAELTDEITRTDKLLRNLTGSEPRFLRPPMGLFSKRVLNIVERSGYTTVVGDVYPRDPHLPGKHKIVDRVVTRAVKGSIIILHDGGSSGRVDRSQTIWAVNRIIPRLKEQGFEFVTLSELRS